MDVVACDRCRLGHRLQAGSLRYDRVRNRTLPVCRAMRLRVSAYYVCHRASARELLGLAAIKFGDLDAAGRWFDQIVSDAEAPSGAKQRAEAFLGLVRSDRKPAK